MKKLAIVLALTALAASPALAKNTPKRVSANHAYQTNNGPIIPEEGWMAYAYYPGSDVVVEDGEILGRDPDPNVRLQLRRDSDIKDSAGSAD
jgi:hypothetical protein